MKDSAVGSGTEQCEKGCVTLATAQRLVRLQTSKLAVSQLARGTTSPLTSAEHPKTELRLTERMLQGL